MKSRQSFTMTPTPAKKETATQMYRKRQKAIKLQMAILQEKLERHGALQAKDPKNWGYTGDLGHVKELLEEINNFVK